MSSSPRRKKPAISPATREIRITAVAEIAIVPGEEEIIISEEENALKMSAKCTENTNGWTAGRIPRIKITINVPADLGTVTDAEAVNVNKSRGRKATMFERRRCLSPRPLDAIMTPN